MLSLLRPPDTQHNTIMTDKNKNKTDTMKYAINSEKSKTMIVGGKCGEGERKIYEVRM